MHFSTTSAIAEFKVKYEYVLFLLFKLIYLYHSVNLRYVQLSLLIYWKLLVERLLRLSCESYQLEVSYL